jgi:hypothetical protein
MSIVLTDDQLAFLNEEADRLADHADATLDAAKVSDDPEDWDAWKEADGIATGYAMALRALSQEPTEPTEPVLSYDEWCAAYRPMTNTINEHAAFGGNMFETYGSELAAVRATEPARIWTIVSTDDNALCVVSGFHVVDRLGYLITERPWIGAVPLAITIG